MEIKINFMKEIEAYQRFINGISIRGWGALPGFLTFFELNI